MSSTNGTTTLVCLFHQDSHAKAAVEDLYKAGVDRESVTTVNGKSNETSLLSTLETLGVPQRDIEHLQQGVTRGGTLVIVPAIAEHVSAVERIFGNLQATKIDEATRDLEATSLPGAASGEETTIPIVEEELQVGKRTVDRGGVRVFRRVVEMPAEASVTLREEHVVINRVAVDRPATQDDLNAQVPRSIELTETAEEVVSGKSAHVVEEVLIGKVAGEHTEHIRDTVRRTEVQVEELESSNAPNNARTTP